MTSQLPFTKCYSSNTQCHPHSHLPGIWHLSATLKFIDYNVAMTFILIIIIIIYGTSVNKLIKQYKHLFYSTLFIKRIRCQSLRTETAHHKSITCLDCLLSIDHWLILLLLLLLLLRMNVIVMATLQSIDFKVVEIGYGNSKISYKII